MITGQVIISVKDELDWFFADMRNWYLPTLIGILFIALEFPNAYRAHHIGKALWIFALIFIGVMGTYIAVYGVLSLLKYRRFTDNQKQITWEIDADKLVMTDAAGNRFESPWAQFKSISLKRKGWLLRRKHARSQWITRRAFTPDMTKKLEALVQEKLGG